MSEGKELKARAAARIGTVLHGKYRVDAVLGIGGMGAVFATTHRNQKRFAVKILHPELSLRADLRQRFVREGYVANSLQHPGAVAILDDDVAEDGAAFLVMELLEGATVDRVWQVMDRSLPSEAVIAMAHQLLDTLAVGHGKAIVHRDIKPANLFLQRDGAVKVLDFGIARLKDATAADVTNTGALLGTPAYMAPEQAAGETSRIAGETDVWAVGATMFTLLSGSFVRSGESGQRMVIEAATKPARSLAAERPDLPPALLAIVDKALSFDKSDRGSAAEMRDALARANESIFGAPVTRAPLLSLLVEYDARDKPSSETAAAAMSPVAASASPPAPLTPSVPATLGESGAGGTTAQSVSKAAPAADKPPPRPKRWRAAVPALALAGVGSLLVVAFLRPPPALRAAPPVPLGHPELPAPSPPASASAPPAPPPTPEAQTVKLAISPPTAAVEVDGVSAAVEGGMVNVKGAVGSAHIVHVVSGRQDAVYPVLITESGAVPRRVALSTSPAQPVAKAREDAHAKPEAPPVAQSASSPAADPPPTRKME